MYGEIDGYEYAKAIEDANKSISTKGFECLHNNIGWLGYYITTPKGNKYKLIKKGMFQDGYFLCEYSSGKSLDLNFEDLEECKQYLMQNE